MPIFPAFPKSLYSNSESEKNEEITVEKNPKVPSVAKAKDKGRRLAIEEKEKEKEKDQSESFEFDEMKDDAGSINSTYWTTSEETTTTTYEGKRKGSREIIDELIDDLTRSNNKENIPISSVKRKTRVKTTAWRKMPRTN